MWNANQVPSTLSLSDTCIRLLDPSGQDNSTVYWPLGTGKLETWETLQRAINIQFKPRSSVGIVTVYGGGRSRNLEFESRQEQSVHTTSGAQQLSVQRVPWPISQGLKRPNFKTDPSPRPTRLHGVQLN